MTVSRVVSILIAIAVSIFLERYYGYSSWVSFSIGVMASLIARYIAYFFRVRREISEMKARAMREHLTK